MLFTFRIYPSFNKMNLLFIITFFFQHSFICSADQYKFLHVASLLCAETRQEDAYLHGISEEDTESHGARVRRHLRATSVAQSDNTACKRRSAGLSKQQRLICGK